jgi:hypothetical protein
VKVGLTDSGNSRKALPNRPLLDTPLKWLLSYAVS